MKRVLARCTAAVFLAACSAAEERSPGASTTRGEITNSGMAATKNVFVIVMENKNWADVKGSGSAPYITGILLPAGAHAEKYVNPLPDPGPYLHPSLPNYLWMEAGDDFGVRDAPDPAGGPSKNGQTGKDHLVRRLDAAGISWKSWHEGISGSGCPLTDTALYAVRHNPMVYFDDVNSDSRHCEEHVRPYSELSDATAARFNFIIPDVCHDMHDVCGTMDKIRQGDDWLRAEIPKIQALTAYRDDGAIFIVWDESDDHGTNDPTGLILLSANGKKNYSNAVPYTHSSLLRTLQDIFGVNATYLGHAADVGVNDLGDLFSQSCTPATCPADGNRCGSMTDGCGGTIDCGTCTPPLTCGGGGAANVCGGGSGAVAWRATARSSYGSASTRTLTVAAPPGAQPGDLLLASIGFGSSAATVQPTLTAPAGWALVRRSNLGASDALAVYWHVFASGEAAYSWSAGVPVGGTAWISAYSGADTTAPIDVEAGQAVAISGTRLSTPSITTRAANETLVASFYAHANVAGTNTWTPPPTMTARVNLHNGTSRSALGSDAAQAAVGPSGVFTATASISENYGIVHLAALKPGGACEPTTCAAQRKNCGSIPDGCGATIDCGSCTSPQTCGGDGSANVCGGGAGGISWRATATRGFGSGSTRTLTLPVPTGTQAGDVLVASLGFGSTGAAAQPTMAAPAGWTLVRRTNHGAVGALATYWHVAVPGETAFTWATDAAVGGNAWISSYSGVSTAAPVDVEAGQALSAPGRTISTPSLTTTGAGEVLVAGFYAHTNGASTNRWTAPATMTPRANFDNGGSRSALGAEKVQVVAATSGSFTATASLDEDYAITQLFALRPAVSGPCTPTTCAAQGKTCGNIPDGCGGLVGCGSCTSPLSCGGGGAPNVCGASAIAWRATATKSYGSRSTRTLTVPAPSGTQVGDVLVATLGFGDTGATVQPVLTAPAGWTLVRRTNIGGYGALAVYWHAFSTGETSYSWTSSSLVGGNAWISAYSGVDLANAVDVEAGSAFPSGGSSMAAGPVTTTAANGFLVAAWYGHSASGSTNSWTAPATATPRANINNGGSRSALGADLPQSASGPSGTFTAASSVVEDYAISHLLALKAR
jgi:phosphatidylinositol-3-phosphatase